MGLKPAWEMTHRTDQAVVLQVQDRGGFEKKIQSTITRKKGPKSKKKKKRVNMRRGKYDPRPRSYSSPFRLSDNLDIVGQERG